LNGNRRLVVIPMVKWRWDELERMYGGVVVVVVEMGTRATAAESLLSRADRGDGRDGRICRRVGGGCDWREIGGGGDG